MDQDEKCYACGRRLSRTSGQHTVLTSDGSAVYVGTDCLRKIRAGGKAGYQPPLGGPVLLAKRPVPESGVAAK